MDLLQRGPLAGGERLERLILLAQPTRETRKRAPIQRANRRGGVHSREALCALPDIRLLFSVVSQQHVNYANGPWPFGDTCIQAPSKSKEAMCWAWGRVLSEALIRTVM
jgi:hypothetical protein